MRSDAVRRVAVCAAVGAAVLAGCGTTTDGSAGPTTTVRDLDKIEVFNPCRGALSDDALRGAGLDPATKRITTDPPTGVSTWRVCSWQPLDDRYGSGRRSVGVYSTSHTLDEARAKESLTDIREVRVNSRPGLIYRDKAVPDSCYAAFEAEQGMFNVDVVWTSSEGRRVGDLCDMAAKYAEALEPNLPK
ncbi:DUF3558 domain-containing protein [Nocardia thailandica]|uniref:DUF3558 domain-containing protein n=1 Tax=Nocardia thailandica TaxID=257275 RepID=A0ABW6PKT7_9NOCA|nr:DUF3558 domain-containing protein [Nocardia thailandica]